MDSMILLICIALFVLGAFIVYLSITRPNKEDFDKIKEDFDKIKKELDDIKASISNKAISDLFEEKIGRCDKCGAVVIKDYYSKVDIPRVGVKIVASSSLYPKPAYVLEDYYLCPKHMREYKEKNDNT
jgi:hypothetical protein